MTTRRVPPGTTNAFTIVETLGLQLPDVELETKYDGSPVLRLAGAFMAGLATHASAEPNSLVMRAEPGERDLWIQDAPDTYYLTDYYRFHPVVLVRLERVTPDVLRSLLKASHRLTLPKTRRTSAAPRRLPY